MEEPEFYVYLDEKKEIVWLGCAVMGYMFARAFTYDEWMEWAEKYVPRITKTPLSSAWSKWDTELRVETASEIK